MYLPKAGGWSPRGVQRRDAVCRRRRPGTQSCRHDCLAPADYPTRCQRDLVGGYTGRIHVKAAAMRQAVVQQSTRRTRSAVRRYASWWRPRRPWMVCGSRIGTSPSPARHTTWKGSITTTTSGSSWVAAVLNPVNLRLPRSRRATAASERSCFCSNACYERPLRRSGSRAGAVPARTCVRPTITLTYLSPRSAWRHACSSMPIA